MGGEEISRGFQWAGIGLSEALALSGERVCKILL